MKQINGHLLQETCLVSVSPRLSDGKMEDSGAANGHQHGDDNGAGESYREAGVCKGNGVATRNGGNSESPFDEETQHCYLNGVVKDNEAANENSVNTEIVEHRRPECFSRKELMLLKSNTGLVSI